MNFQVTNNISYFLRSDSLKNSIYYCCLFFIDSNFFFSLPLAFLFWYWVIPFYSDLAVSFFHWFCNSHSKQTFSLSSIAIASLSYLFFSYFSHLLATNFLLSSLSASFSNSVIFFFKSIHSNIPCLLQPSIDLGLERIKFECVLLVFIVRC